MNTLIFTLALSNALLAAPSWQTSYQQAQTEAAAQKKPLVVFFGSGAKGWANVVREQTPAPEVTKLLSDRYVCVFVDTSSEPGKKLAQNFDIAGNVGMVISDRTGSVQAFWHQGDLPNQSLTQYLQKYADPNLPVNGTETVNSSRMSFYPSQGAPSSARPANC